ncbi:hypothetical protein [Mesoplasma melaleucae]|uniref:Uncharacterized protein n=1 Tax=Mesoplasma melaleucae TaxID=81459 RepID=A0A2K8NZI5_9MOLU|nr:hypothetical protein [Mesoplasma melaleucae]ATZ18043.1 hypothetical protein EMELA_v1c05030 [Mesoplasma melaleucae]
MNNEIEIDFLEPSLAIIISSLENIETELKSNDHLTKILDQLNEVEEINELSKILANFKKLEKELLSQIKALKYKEEFDIICDLQIASAMSNYLGSDKFLFKFTDSLEARAQAKELIITQENILEIYKEEIILQINKIYTEAILKFKNVFNNDHEFMKVLKIAAEENNLNDLREASKLLVNILKIERTIDDVKKYELLEVLNKAESLVNLIDIWSQYEMDFEEE